MEARGEERKQENRKEARREEKEQGRRKEASRRKRANMKKENKERRMEAREIRRIQVVPRVQVKRRPSATGLLLRTHSADPVSQTCLLTTSKARADYALKPSMTRLHNEELVN